MLNDNAYTNMLPEEHDFKQTAMPIEYWECEECFKHVDKIVKKNR